MFKVPDNAKIELQQMALHAPGRVWLDLPLNANSHDSGFNIIEVSVLLDDLERAIAEYRSRVVSHA
jgi:hypothetical protein